MRNTQTNELPALELVPSRLYALGANIPLDGRISWIPAGWGGYMPVNCYLLMEGSGALLIDTGLALTSPIVLRQLEDLLEPGSEISVILTRPEPDVFGGLAAIHSRYRVGLHTMFGSAQGVRNPFEDFFSGYYLRQFDPDNAGFDAPLIHVKHGDKVLVGSDRYVQVVAPAIKLLITHWVYDPGTSTLFTSDALTHVMAAASDSPRFVDKVDPTLTPELIMESLTAKFWWLPKSRPGAVAAQFAATFGTHAVENIAPAYGCVLWGRETVTQHYEMLLDGLRAL